jgi:hypothetical protein
MLMVQFNSGINMVLITILSCRFDVNTGAYHMGKCPKYPLGGSYYPIVYMYAGIYTRT